MVHVAISQEGRKYVRLQGGEYPQGMIPFPPADEKGKQPLVLVYPPIPLSTVAKQP